MDRHLSKPNSHLQDVTRSKPLLLDFYKGLLVLVDVNNRSFPKINKVSNVTDKDFHKEEPNKSSKNKLTPMGIEPRPSCDLL